MKSSPATLSLGGRLGKNKKKKERKEKRKKKERKKVIFISFAESKLTCTILVDDIPISVSGVGKSKMRQCLGLKQFLS